MVQQYVEKSLDASTGQSHEMANRLVVGHTHESIAAEEIVIHNQLWISGMRNIQFDIDGMRE